MYREEFEKYLQEEKRTSGNTLRAYTRDVTRFDIFLRERGITDDINASNADIVAYLIELKNSGASKSTVNRKLSSIRIYYDFLVRKALLKENPADNIRSPKIEKKSMDFLSPDEINRLIDSELEGKTEMQIEEFRIRMLSICNNPNSTSVERDNALYAVKYIENKYYNKK